MGQLLGQRGGFRPRVPRGEAGPLSQGFHAVVADFICEAHFRISENDGRFSRREVPSTFE
jgi:hypothetical protein